MSNPSEWPLPPDGKRFLLPKALTRQLAQQPLSQGLYPRAMGFYPVALRHQMTRTEHDDHLLLYCTGGLGWLAAYGEVQPVKRGDVLLLPAGQPHRYWADAQKPWTVYWVHFDGRLAQQFIDWLAIPKGVRALGLNARLLSLFDVLFELRQRGSAWTPALHSCHQLQLLLSHVALLFVQQGAGSGKRLDLERVKTLMTEHLHGQLNLGELAADANLSKYHFAKCFKAQSGQSPIHYFIELKMQHACYLLDSSRVPVKQVALNLGYEDAYYFSRAFKKIMGVSPATYRAGLHTQGTN
jgi:AraC-like DNA-binding protein